jgi:hypothetical protein
MNTSGALAQSWYPECQLSDSALSQLVLPPLIFYWKEWCTGYIIVPLALIRISVQLPIGF